MSDFPEVWAGQVVSCGGPDGVNESWVRLADYLRLREAQQQLVEKWLATIEQLRDEQLFANTGEHVEKLGHRLDVYRRCVDQLAALQPGSPQEP